MLLEPAPIGRLATLKCSPSGSAALDRIVPWYPCHDFVFVAVKVPELRQITKPASAPQVSTIVLLVEISVTSPQANPSFASHGQQQVKKSQS